jgi:hypothetical protein
MLKYIALATTWLAPFSTLLVKYRLSISIGAGVYISRIIPNSWYYFRDKKIAENGELVFNLNLFKPYQELITKLEESKLNLNNKSYEIINNLYELAVAEYTGNSDESSESELEERLSQLGKFLNNHIQNDTEIRFVLPQRYEVIEIYRVNNKFEDFCNAIKPKILVQNIFDIQELNIEDATEKSDNLSQDIKKGLQEDYIKSRYTLLQKSLRSAAHLSIVLLASAILPVPNAVKAFVCGLAVVDAYMWAPANINIESRMMNEYDAHVRK